MAYSTAGDGRQQFVVSNMNRLTGNPPAFKSASGAGTDPRWAALIAVYHAARDGDGIAAYRWSQIEQLEPGLARMVPDVIKVLGTTRRANKQAAAAHRDALVRWARGDTTADPAGLAVPASTGKSLGTPRAGSPQAVPSDFTSAIHGSHAAAFALLAD